MKDVHVIKSVKANSIAEELELVPGDAVLEVNHTSIEDVFDYQYLINDEYIELLVRKEDGEEWLLEIEKDFDEDLGIEFESGLMDDYKSCSNRCVFCFIDQLPPGMRPTMYFKDDDSRLSFLQGNYITMTNMKDKDLQRIVKYKLAPINISVHTTNPQLRCEMLHNRFAGKILEQLRMLYDNHIIMNAQIVLCKNINDGIELEKTITDLSRFLPYMESVSVVPMGMTKFRDHLPQIEPFNHVDANAVIDIIENWQQRLYEEYGTHFIHAGDEWYIMAGRDLPEADRYDGYLQLENGVGMMRLLIDEFMEVLSELGSDSRFVRTDSGHLVRNDGNDFVAKDIVTGKLAYPYLVQLIEALKSRFENLEVRVHMIENHFFGESITVSGLLTGSDVISQLEGQLLGKHLLMPCNMLRAQEEVLLDDVTVLDIEKALQVKVDIIQSSGKDLIDTILK